MSDSTDGGRYWPALDGVRAVAVSSVVAFHLGYLPGGWIGVDIFFVLSGFLITSLLVGEADRSERVSLTAFWGRRARRLLPGVLALLGAVGLYCLAGGPLVVAAQLRWPALSTLFYGANWQQIAVGHSYFAQFSAPDPLTHTWSLAIEEQYYLVWPLVVATVAAVSRRRGWSTRRVVGRTALVLGLASAAWMGVAAHRYGFNRAYLGTDTRAWELLFGAAAAVWLGPLRHRPLPSVLTGARPWTGVPAEDVADTAPGALTKRGRVGTRALWTWLPVAAVVGVAVAIWRGGGPPSWMWDGGLVATSLGALAVVVGVTRAPSGPVAVVLSARPLRWLGRISYSLYLWHWPVIVLLTGTDTGLTGASLLGARLATMTGLSCASYYLVERPLRQADWREWRRRALAPVAVLGTAGVLVLATVTPATAGVAALRPTVAKVPAGLPITLPAGRVPSAANPLRVWILGDSVMYDSSLGVTAALQATGQVKVVANSSFGGWGLSTDKYWPGDGEQIIRQYHPELVIGTWSWDNPEAQSDPSAYEARLKATLSDLLAPGDGVDDVVLLQFPVTGPYPLYPTKAAQTAAWISTLKGEDAWDAVAQKAVAAFPGHAAYMTTASLFAPGGKFMVWMKTPSGQWLRARKVDDIHVCPYGAAELGDFIESNLAPSLGLGSMAPGWQDGAWTHDPRYNDPDGACPADQPSSPAHYEGTALPNL